MKTLIKNGYIVDPQESWEGKGNLLIEKGVISKKGAFSVRAFEKKSHISVVDVRGKVVIPGLVDMHVHLREPGREDEETVYSGTRAAAKGGITSLCAMPNTEPVIDSVAGIKFIHATALQDGVVNVYPAGAITRQQKGEALAEIGEMAQAGAVAITDDGSCIMNSLIMRRALEYAQMFGIIVIDHPEDKNLSADGVMNEGLLSTVLGLKGIPRQAESVIVARDITLAQLTGTRLHLAHISACESVEFIREAKKRKVRVTCEVTPHHLLLMEENVRGYNTQAKVNPPLRSREDTDALIAALKDGTIDCIASDHAPHTDVEKDQEFDQAPFGIIGLETMLPLIVTHFIMKKTVSWKKGIAAMTCNPARILGIPRGTLAVGAAADVTVVDIRNWRAVEKEFASKSANSPFIGESLTGYPEHVWVGGKLVVENGALRV